MAILPILKYPDSRLREVSKEIISFDEAQKSFLHQLTADMLETMYSEQGIGLAAAQVGQLINLLVIDTRPRESDRKSKKTKELKKTKESKALDETNAEAEEEDEFAEPTELELKIDQPLIICNPILKSQQGQVTFDEGCLSVPSFYETVKRSRRIELEYQNLNGEKQSLIVDGLLAIVIQHEMDHLDGRLFIDHLNLILANRIKNKIKKYGYPPKKKNKAHQNNSKDGSVDKANNADGVNVNNDSGDDNDDNNGNDGNDDVEM